MESCYNCKWLSGLFVAVCLNEDSKSNGDFMDRDDCCEHWEPEKEPGKNDKRRV